MGPISNIKNAHVLLNGIVIQGWSEDDDALDISDPEDAYDTKFGADGRMISGAKNIQGGTITFKLLANSPSINLLQTAWEAVKTGASTIWNGSIKYEDGSTILLNNGVMNKAPNGYTIGSGAAKSMQYEFKFETIAFETITAGGN